jgi:hypothetical protein
MKKIILISLLFIIAFCFFMLHSVIIKAARETPYEGLLHRSINTGENSITFTCNSTPWSYRNCSPVGSTITLYQ